MDDVVTTATATAGTIESVLLELWSSVYAFMPNLFFSILVLIIGVLVAKALSQLVVKLVEITKVDNLVDSLGINKTFKAVGKIKVSAILGWLVKWFLILVVLMAIAEILGLNAIIDFLGRIAAYLPKVAIAIVILLIGFVAGNFVYEIVYRSVKVTKMHSPKFLANLAKWSIVILALMASLLELEIAPSLVQTLFTGLIAMLSLAGGIAFGLGGQDAAKKFIADMKKKL